MPKSPQVSVILPTYNRAPLLSRAVESVLGQSFRDLELVVVDDHSDDGSIDWLNSVQDSRVRILRLDRRCGAAVARNRGIEAAHASLIAFQDSDDEWTANKLERQMALLEASVPEVGWVGGAWRAGGRMVRSAQLERGQGYDGDLASGLPFVTPTWLVRKGLLEQAGQFDPGLPCLEDWDLILKLSSLCEFRAVPEVVLIRHDGGDSLYRNLPKRLQGLQTIISRHADRFTQHPKWRSHWYGEIARLHSVCGNRDIGRQWLLRALWADPFRRSTWVLLLKWMFARGWRAARL